MDEQQMAAGQSPIYQESGEKNAKWLWLLILLIIIGALVFAYLRGIGPFASLKSQVSEETASPSPSPFVFSTPSPEASTEADVDKKSAKIRVLNGSGTSGVASTVKTLLEDNGWTVVSIGNANNYDYSQTVLRFKTAFEKFGNALTKDLSGKYSVSTSTESLEATDSADVEVIVGSK